MSHSHSSDSISRRLLLQSATGAGVAAGQPTPSAASPAELFADLIADPDTDFGLDPSWVHIYPYQATAAPGESRRYEIRVRNHRKRPIAVEAALVLPAGWISDPRSVTMNIEPGTERHAPLTVTTPAGFRSPPTRIAIAADVIADGKYLGQIAEAVVDLQLS